MNDMGAQAIGRRQVVKGIIDPFRVAALAEALGVPAPLNDILPLPWHWTQLLDVPAASGIDGHPAKGGFLPDVGLPRRMWAASEVQSLRPLRIGRAASRTSTITASREKTGRTGRLHFFEVKHQWVQNAAICLSERQTIVYREAFDPAAGSAAAPASPPQDAEMSMPVLRTLAPDPVLLFRYSALTYNAHRIHYDLPYAREVEGYPSLVVHGPLIASLLLAASGVGQRASRFSFRAERAAFADQELELRGSRNGDHLDLVSVDYGRRVTMRAEATLRKEDPR